MNDAATELFRQQLLNALLAGDCHVGLNAQTICIGVRSLGFPRASLEETVEHIEYLQAAGLVREVPKEISRVNRAWRIADAGRRYADEHRI